MELEGNVLSTGWEQQLRASIRPAGVHPLHGDMHQCPSLSSPATCTLVIGSASTYIFIQHKACWILPEKKKNNNAASTSGQKGIHGTWGKSVLCKRSVWHSSWGNSLCWASLNCSPSFLPPIFLALPSHRKNCFKGSRVVLVAILPQASVQHRFCRST